MEKVKSNEQLGILVDLSLCMSTFMFGLLVSKEKSDEFFGEIKGRYKRQGMDENITNETINEMKEIVDVFRKGE